MTLWDNKMMICHGLPIVIGQLIMNIVQKNYNKMMNKFVNCNSRLLEKIHLGFLLEFYLQNRLNSIFLKSNNVTILQLEWQAHKGKIDIFNPHPDPKIEQIHNRNPLSLEATQVKV